MVISFQLPQFYVPRGNH